ncbi:hypothetical protein PILCRDRAFT_48484, partial [Piloderma croceum F 1598]
TACLQGTRTKIIESIIDWGTDISSEQNILWLHGLAGSGKSTISTTVADHFHEIGILGAYVFFDRKFAQESHPTAVIRTLAYQLSLARPGVATAISAIIDITPTISALPIQRQFQQLLLDPLLTEGTIETDKPLILVLDAFDECGTAKEREDLLEQLVERSTRFPRNIRIFITSRPEKDIHDAFELQSHILVQELDITSDANISDISSYFRHRMVRIRKKNISLSLGVDWPGEDGIQKLTERASGLFVWAATASEFLNGHDPRIRLGIILGGEPMREAESALDCLYQTALLSAGSWDDADFVADFRDILGLVLVARTPLSSAAIDALLCTAHGRPSIHTIGRLGCVLSAGPTVRVLHPSFADFLSSRTRCGREIWHIDPPAFHQRLLTQCLKRLDLFLKRNMCNLSLSHDELSASLPEDIAYACVHWIDHLDIICVAPIIDLLVAFLNQHLLHWFESMTILEGARTTTSLLNKLSQDLAELIDDARRLSLWFKEEIEYHPLMIYVTALPFCPVTSSIYKTFHDTHLFPSVVGGYQQSWSPLLHVIDTYRPVLAMAASFDGKLVCGSWNGVFRIGDTSLQGYTDRVNSVALSHDGMRIASGLDDLTIRIWDVTSGVQLLPTLQGHEGRVNSVAYSPDGTRIVSASDDMTVRAWDTSSGKEILPILRGHNGPVNSVAYSPDGAWIVSGSDDTTLRIWNSSLENEALSVLRGHEQSVSSVAVSPDGTKIISGSDDKTIRVWDTHLGVEIIPPLRGHEDRVNSVTFYADGTRIASGSEDETIRIWDISSGVQVLEPLQGHYGGITSVTCISDDTQLVTSSLDGTVRLWDTSAYTTASTASRGHQGAILSVSFSSDGTRIASGSQDKTIRVWDAASSVEIVPVLRGHEDAVCSVSFSTDGTRIVSGSVDTTVRVWNASSGGEAVSVLQGHKASVNSVVFSPNGAHIVSGSDDKTIRVWDTLLGVEVLHELRGHTDVINSVAICPECCSSVISGSDDKTIRLWDLSSG